MSNIPKFKNGDIVRVKLGNRMMNNFLSGEVLKVNKHLERFGTSNGIEQRFIYYFENGGTIGMYEPDLEFSSLKTMMGDRI